MIDRPPAQHRTPRYKALPLIQDREVVWTIYDTLEQRSVAQPLQMRAAHTLAYTLNVADLTVVAKTFEGQRQTGVLIIPSDLLS
jgi:hypothetical protein